MDSVDIEDARVQSDVLFLTDEEFNEWIRTDDGLEITKETTDYEILERVMSEVHGNETVDVDEDDDAHQHGISQLGRKSSRLGNKIGSLWDKPILYKRFLLY